VSPLTVMIDFVNLKIKLAQSFEGDHRDRLCVRVCINRGKCSYGYKYLYLYCVTSKKNFIPMLVATSNILLCQIVGKSNMCPMSGENCICVCA
jgi:hypothetical protein